MLVESIKFMDSKMVKGSSLNPKFIFTCAYILYTWVCWCICTYENSILTNRLCQDSFLCKNDALYSFNENMDAHGATRKRQLGGESALDSCCVSGGYRTEF